MSIKIEVAGSYIKSVTGSKGENAGKQFQIPMVEAYAHLPGERYPIKVDYSLGKGDAAPVAGTYMLGPKSFYVDQYGALQLRRTLDLMPMGASSTAGKAS